MFLIGVSSGPLVFCLPSKTEVKICQVGSFRLFSACFLSISFLMTNLFSDNEVMIDLLNLLNGWLLLGRCFLFKLFFFEIPDGAGFLTTKQSCQNLDSYYNFESQTYVAQNHGPQIVHFLVVNCIFGGTKNNLETSQHKSTMNLLFKLYCLGAASQWTYSPHMVGVNSALGKLVIFNHDEESTIVLNLFPLLEALEKKLEI